MLGVGFRVEGIGSGMQDLQPWVLVTGFCVSRAPRLSCWNSMSNSSGINTIGVVG